MVIRKSIGLVLLFLSVSVFSQRFEAGLTLSLPGNDLGSIGGKQPLTDSSYYVVSTDIGLSRALFSPTFFGLSLIHI